MQTGIMVFGKEAERQDGRDWSIRRYRLLWSKTKNAFRGVIGMIWNEEMECCSRARMEDLQAERLRETVRWAYARVPFYGKRFEEAEP